MDNRRSRIVYQFTRFLFLLAASFTLTSCIDLAAQPKIPQHLQIKPRIQGRVYCMRGGLGGIFSTGMNQLQRTLEKNYKIRTSSIIWYRTNQLSDEITKDFKTGKITKPIVLIGHSLGANEQIKVARNLWTANIPVDLLITVDAVSPQTIPPNVKYALNIYTTSLVFVPMFSGLKIKAMDSKATRVENLDVSKLHDVRVNHFTIDKHKNVQEIMLEKILNALGTHKKHHQIGLS